MGSRDVESVDPTSSPPFGDLVLRTAPNWTAVGFFGALGALHLTIAITTFFSGRWECYLSVMFGSVFVIVAYIASRFRYELAVLVSERRLRLRNGVSARMCVERVVPFAAVRGVRLTLSSGRRDVESKLELLCGVEDVECPPTDIPRQEALLLAMVINVPLIKVSEGTLPCPDPATCENPQDEEPVQHAWSEEELLEARRRLI